jgi:hypothetical protein
MVIVVDAECGPPPPNRPNVTRLNKPANPPGFPRSLSVAVILIVSWPLYVSVGRVGEGAVGIDCHRAVGRFACDEVQGAVGVGGRDMTDHAAVDHDVVGRVIGDRGSLVEVEQATGQLAPRQLQKTEQRRRRRGGCERVGGGRRAEAN